MTAALITVSVIALAALTAAAVLWARATRTHYRLQQAMSDNEHLRCRLETLSSDRQAQTDTFKAVAADILRVTTADLTRDNRERLEALLTPLRQRIDTFEQTVSRTYSAESRERFALQQVIADLAGANRDIAANAKALSDALHGNTRVQGQWGEMVLETILERSGLKRGVHFVTQATADASGATLTGASGQRLRPDVVLNLPDNRCLVIDSKVSLTGYLEYAESEDARRRQDALQRHLRSVRAHLRELSDKNYQDYIGDRRQDFVLMFIPNEGAYLAAMSASDTLWQEAYDRRVLVVSPTHLISVVRLIEQLWKQDDISRNAKAIADESGKMLGKFTDFVADLQRVGSALDSARRAHDAAINKLVSGRGNLISRAGRIEHLGTKSTKPLPDALRRLADEDTTED